MAQALAGPRCPRPGPGAELLQRALVDGKNSPLGNLSKKRLNEGKMSARRSTFPQIPTLRPATHSLWALSACHPSSPRYLGYLRLPTWGDSGDGGREGRCHPVPLSRPLLAVLSRIYLMVQLPTFPHAPGHPGVHWGTYGKAGDKVLLPRGPGTAQG